MRPGMASMESLVCMQLAEVLHSPTVRTFTDCNARFVDFGSGGGRLLLAVAAMGNWKSVSGLEVGEGLHEIACESIVRAETANAVPPDTVSSIHTDSLPHEGHAAEVMARADVCFMYSTVFPSEDGLRLPELSASLSCVLREGSLVISTDALLVGPRFAFEALVQVDGDAPDEGEPRQRHSCYIWRIVGERASSFEEAYAEVMAEWMSDEALMRDEALFEVLSSHLDQTLEKLEELDRDRI